MATVGRKVYAQEHSSFRTPDPPPPLNEPLGGYIFVCNNETMEDDLKRELFGLPQKYQMSVRGIQTGMPLFLYNYSTKELHGIFEASSDGGLNLDPEAWETSKDSKNGWQGSRFPSQVKVRLRERKPSLAEDKFRPYLHHYDGPKFRLELSQSQTESLLGLFYGRAGTLPAPSPATSLAGSHAAATVAAREQEGGKLSGDAEHKGEEEGLWEEVKPKSKGSRGAVQRVAIQAKGGSSMPATWRNTNGAAYHGAGAHESDSPPGASQGQGRGREKEDAGHRADRAAKWRSDPDTWAAQPNRSISANGIAAAHVSDATDQSERPKQAAPTTTNERSPAGKPRLMKAEANGGAIRATPTKVATSIHRTEEGAGTQVPRTGGSAAAPRTGSVSFAAILRGQGSAGSSPEVISLDGDDDSSGADSCPPSFAPTIVSAASAGTPIVDISALLAVDRQRPRAHSCADTTPTAASKKAHDGEHRGLRSGGGNSRKAENGHASWQEKSWVGKRGARSHAQENGGGAGMTHAVSAELTNGKATSQPSVTKVARQARHELHREKAVDSVAAGTPSAAADGKSEQALPTSSSSSSRPSQPAPEAPKRPAWQGNAEIFRRLADPTPSATSPAAGSEDTKSASPAASAQQSDSPQTVVFGPKPGQLPDEPHSKTRGGIGRSSPPPPHADGAQLTTPALKGVSAGQGANQGSATLPRSGVRPNQPHHQSKMERSSSLRKQPLSHKGVDKFSPALLPPPAPVVHLMQLPPGSSLTPHFRVITPPLPSPSLLPHLFVPGAPLPPRGHDRRIRLGSAAGAYPDPAASAYHPSGRSMPDGMISPQSPAAPMMWRVMSPPPSLPSTMAPLFPQVAPELLTNAAALHDEILAYAEVARPSREARAQAQAAVDQVRAVVQGLWEGADVEVFGSFATGLALPHSDIDVAVIEAPIPPPNPEGGALSGARINAPLVLQLASAIQGQSWCEQLSTIDTARIPVIKLRCRVPTNPQRASQQAEAVLTPEVGEAAPTPTSKGDPPLREGAFEDEKPDVAGVGLAAPAAAKGASAAIATGGSKQGAEGEPEQGYVTVAMDITIAGSRAAPSGEDADVATRQWLARVEEGRRAHNGAAAREFVIQRLWQLPALAPLVLLLKSYLNARGLNDVYTGGLGSFSLTLMLILYLERAPVSCGSSYEENSDHLQDASTAVASLDEASSKASTAAAPLGDAAVDDSASADIIQTKIAGPAKVSASSEDDLSRPGTGAGDGAVGTSSAAIEESFASASDDVGTGDSEGVGRSEEAGTDPNGDGDTSPDILQDKTSPTAAQKVVMLDREESLSMETAAIRDASAAKVAASIPGGSMAESRTEPLAKQQAVRPVRQMGTILEELPGRLETVPSPNLGTLLSGFLLTFGQELDLSRVKLVLKGQGGSTGGVFWHEPANRPVALWIDDPLRPGANIGAGSFAMYKVQAAMRDMLNSLVQPLQDGVAAQLSGDGQMAMPILDHVFNSMCPLPSPVGISPRRRSTSPPAPAGVAV